MWTFKKSAASFFLLFSPTANASSNIPNETDCSSITDQQTCENQLQCGWFNNQCKSGLDHHQKQDAGQQDVELISFKPLPFSFFTAAAPDPCESQLVPEGCDVCNCTAGCDQRACTEEGATCGSGCDQQQTKSAHCDEGCNQEQ